MVNVFPGSGKFGEKLKPEPPSELPPGEADTSTSSAVPQNPSLPGLKPTKSGWLSNSTTTAFAVLAVAVEPVEIVDDEPVHTHANGAPHPRLEHRAPVWIGQAAVVDLEGRRVLVRRRDG